MRDVLARWADKAATPLLAAAFNVALFALPVTAAESWRLVELEQAYDWHVDEAAQRQARLAIERFVAAAAPSGDDRRDGLSALVARALASGDIGAARGLLLSAQAVLSPPDAARLAAMLPPNASEDQHVEAALQFLTPQAQTYFRTAAAEGGPLRGAIVLGGLQDLALRAADRPQGEPLPVSLLLAGFAAGVAPSDTPLGAQLQTGASTLEAARRAGALQATYAAGLEARLRAAVDEAALRRELAFALAAGGTESMGAAAAVAFGRSLDPAAGLALTEEITLVAEITRALGPTGAVRLLASIRTPEDMRAARLLALGGGDRAVAAASLTEEPAVLLGLAKRSLRLSPQSGAALGYFSLAAFVAIGAALLALARMARRGKTHGPSASPRESRARRRPQAERNSERMLVDAEPPRA